MTFTTIDIPGYQGRAVRLEQGSTFRVIDVEGCQIADMFVLSAADTCEVFSPALTRQVIFRLTPKPGDFLYSNRRRPMLTFLNDSSPGRHDMAFAPCDPGFYVDLHGARIAEKSSMCPSTTRLRASSFGSSDHSPRSAVPPRAIPSERGVM